MCILKVTGKASKCDSGARLYLYWRRKQSVCVCKTNMCVSARLDRDTRRRIPACTSSRFPLSSRSNHRRVQPEGLFAGNSTSRAFY